MRELLIPALRVAGAGLLLLALLHVPIARRLAWRQEAARMSPFNAAVFHVHTAFICLVLVGIGLPGAIEPAVFLERGRAAAWGCWTLTVFWALRLWCQCFVYRRSWWRGRRLETALHWWFTLVWVFLTALFGACAAWHAGWVS
jgi:hypothetical protein